MRRPASTEHGDGLPITSAVAVHLVRSGVCSGADVNWLRAQNARWHPRLGSYSLPVKGKDRLMEEHKADIAAEAADGDAWLGSGSGAAPLATQLAAVARALRSRARDADRSARAAAVSDSAPDSTAPGRYERLRGRADTLARISLVAAALEAEAVRGHMAGAPWTTLPLDRHRRVLRLAIASVDAEDRMGAGERAVGGHDALRHADAVLRPLLAPLDRYALAVVETHDWTEPVPADAPSEPLDRVIWAHRRLDAPLPVLPRDGGGPVHHADPRALPLMDEEAEFLPPARAWDTRGERWRQAPVTNEHPETP